MSAPPAPDTLASIVRQRARELRDREMGYAEAVEELADEIYRCERGKATRLGELGAIPGLVGPHVDSSTNADALFAKNKKAKAKAIGTLRTLISHWVSDVYEED